MARTPLLRALRRLAREHDAAERLGITPAELRWRRAAALSSRAAELSRRDFLTGAAAVAAVAVTSRILPALAGPQPRIAIVGAGIAGLNAAWQLQDKKHLAATVYEASMRVGGRMHSDIGYFADSQVSEICAELIDSDHTTIADLARDCHLHLDDLVAAQPAGSTDSNWFHNARYSAAQADAAFVPVRQAVIRDFNAAGEKTTFDTHTAKGEELDHTSVHDWIEKNVPGGHGSAFGRLLDAAYTIEFGDNTSEQSSLNLVYMLFFQPSETAFSVTGTSDERFHIRGGNELLPKAIAAKLHTPINFGWRLTAIDAKSSAPSVVLSFKTAAGAKQVVADQVILAIPFTVLRTLDIANAGFDRRKLKAINELGAGRTAKLQLQFRKRLWNQSGPWGISNGNSLADLGFQDAWEVSRAQGGQSGIINDFTGGDTAAALLASSPYARADTDAKVKSYAGNFLDKFETVFPGISAEWNGRATLSTAFRDPLFLCSYSYLKVGQYTAFFGYERISQGAIHFAGEHCSREYGGFMEGAAREGKFAADRVAIAVAH